MRKAKYISVASLCLVAVPALAYGPSVRIGGASLRANGQVAQGFQYTGPCPVDLKFGWGVIPTAPTRLTYRFERSDGGHSSNSFFADLPRPNQSTPVYEGWRLGANNPRFASYSGWVNLIIDEPVPLQQKINFTIHCG
jgi:hypothetical protein